ncbi:signal transduction histidine kinase [Stigmatella aurantiaca]|uniref:histidine kinase n=1 Tax=Stigmatella aurantiaca TaxID=41 RepID=A0A1H7W4W9_STIAU|nr:PAS domain S-box protein [Stigmatella aurantiaca]SEM16531.1 signal transduction histidine kinase [Stigmatella aurantiaca]
MADRIRAFDWPATPLGPLEGWSPQLKAMVELLLRSPLPMTLLWGPEGILIYNSGYAVISGARHPGNLGRSALDAWPEAADFNRHVIAAGRRGESLSFKDQTLVLYRNGVREEVWMDLNYTPVLDAHQQPVGILAILTENTTRVQEEQRRQRAEASLREANERIQLALDAGAVIGTWMWDVPRDHFTGDVRFARSFSIPPEELVEGRALSQVVQSIHPDDRPHVEALIGDALRQGGPYRAEYRVRQLDGSWLWLEANGHVELDAQGQALRFPGVLLNIDARKKAEMRQAFVLSLTDRLRTLSEPRQLLAAATEMLGRKLGVHRVSYAEADLTAGETALLASWSEGPDTPGDGLETLAPGFTARLEQGLTVVHPGGGGQEPGAVLAVPLLREQRLRAVLALSQPGPRVWRPEDISLAEEVATRTWEAAERARAEAALRELNVTLEQQIRERTQERNRLWELSLSPFLVTDLEGHWLSASPTWNQALGWTEKELLGRTSLWLSHPEDEARLREVTAQVAGGQKVQGFENRLRHRDGSYRWFSWWAMPSEGLVYCVARDVTAEKQRQAELERTQEQLRQAQKMEAVGQLTGGIAHDFNNLLAGIVGALNLLDRRLKAGKLDNVQRYIEAATSSAMRAASLTHRLLAFARRQSLDVKPTDINARVVSMEELLRRTLGENIVLRMALEPRLWPALTDSNQFENALLNLVINARDAMPDGGKLTVATSNTHLDEAAARAFDELAPGDYVLLSVSDTGQGMPPEVIARAFEPFFTTKPIGQGTGLGLSMIYGFVRQSGGHVRIESQVGQGTTLSLLLPRHVAEVAASEEPLPGEPPRARLGETILVVEDDASVRMVVMDVLADLGYQAVEAGDAQQALPYIEGRERLDLLITDVGLPGMNGRQLAEIARQRRPGLKVLFATGYAEGAAVRGGFLEPGMEMITKPFSLEALAERVRAMLPFP